MEATKLNTGMRIHMISKVSMPKHTSLHTRETGIMPEWGIQSLNKDCQSVANHSAHNTSGALGLGTHGCALATIAFSRNK